MCVFRHVRVRDLRFNVGAHARPWRRSARVKVTMEGSTTLTPSSRQATTQVNVVPPGAGNAASNLKFLPFKHALLYARSLKLVSRTGWRVWCKSGGRPANIPSVPEKRYKLNGWQGHGHWLGTGTAATKDQQFLPFRQALLHARSLKLKPEKEWRAWRKSAARPGNVPACPEAVYKHGGWQGYGHWLGTGNVGVKKDQQFLPFTKALLHARSLKLKSANEWWDWCKIGVREANMPTLPCLYVWFGLEGTLAGRAQLHSFWSFGLRERA